MSNPNVNSDYNFSKSNQKKLNGLGTLFMVTTFIFLATSVFLFADNQKKSKTIVSTSTELSESAKRYTDLDAKYLAALAEIESYKGKSAELDSLLSVKEKYITTLRSNLNKEKKNRDLSDAEYKRQLVDLNSIVSDLNARVEELQRANTTLTGQRDSLGRDITQKASAITELQNANSALSQKVTVASLLIPTDLTGSAVLSKSSGKEKATSKASKAQTLKICFNVPENKVADAGEKIFFVRILSPEGSVLAIQSQGSGVLTAVETGEQIQYTTTAALDYAQQPKEVCSNWSQATPFAEGNYIAEIYQDGYLVGKTGFELK
jgi:myosin heavy subunit